MPLSPEETTVFGSMRNAKVLQNVEGHRLDESQGVILLSCADGDHFTDIVGHHSGINLEHRQEPRIHTFSLNGGALLVSRKSPLNGALHEDQVLIAHVQKARELKDIHTVALYAHRPCGAARLASIDFEHSIELLLDAKKRLKEELTGYPQQVKVACFFHIDQPHGRRTYHVSREAWEEWKQSSKFYQRAAQQ